MGPFTVDAGLMFWTLVTFGLLILLLSRYAFKPLRRLLAERENSIRASLDQAEMARADAEKVLAANRELLAKARDEARRTMDEGQRIAAQLRREAENTARESADALITKAREEIDREVQRSLSELSSTVANLSVRVAREVIKEQLDERRHQQLADEFLDRLRQTHAHTK